MLRTAPLAIDVLFRTRSTPAEATSRYIANQDMRGLIIPTIEPGTLGVIARAIGAASEPIFAQYLLNTNVVLDENQH